jgi:hypothetical protein
MKKLVLIVTMIILFIGCGNLEKQTKNSQNIDTKWLMYMGYDKVDQAPFYAYLHQDSLCSDYYIILAQDTAQPRWNLMVGQPRNIVHLGCIETRAQLEWWHKRLTNENLVPAF